MKKYYPLFFAASVIIFFWQFFLKGLLPIPSDALVGLYHPFRDLYAENYPNGIPFKNFLITDPVRQQFPWRYIAIDSLKNGELSVWNPYNFSGTPLLANLQTAFFYPLNVLFLFLSFEHGWSILIIIQPLLAGLFMFFYLRNLQLQKEACLLGSIVYSFSGFFIAWLEWNTILHTVLWLPLILLSIDKLVLMLSDETISNIKYQKPARNASHIEAGGSKIQIKNQKLPILRWSLVFIFSLTSSFFAGHLQIFFYVFILSLGYLAIRWWQHGRRKKILLLFAICYLLFAFMTLIQWLPTAKFIFSSERLFDQASWQNEGWFIPWQHLIQFLAPDFFGNPATLNYWGVWNYGEMIGYIGIAPLILAIFALTQRKDKKTLFFGSIFFMSLILSTPNFLAKIPYILKIPFLSSSQPTRLLFIIDFSLSLLAAFGLDFMLKNKVKTLSLIKIIAFFFLVFLTLWSLFVFGSSILPKNWFDNLNIAKRNLIFPSLLFASSAVLLLLINFAFHKKRSKLLLFFTYVVIAVTCFDLLRFGFKFTPFTSKQYLFPGTKSTQFLQEENKKDLFRVMSVDDRLFPANFSSYYKIQTVSGYDPLFLKDYAEFVSAWIRNKPDVSYFDFNRMLNPQNFESRIADLLNIKYVLSLDDLTSDKLFKVYEEGKTKIYENKYYYPRAFLVSNIIWVQNKQEGIETIFNDNIDLRKTAIVYDPIDIDKDEIDYNKEQVFILNYKENAIKLRIITEKKRFLVLTDSYYPAWKVYIDGIESKIYKTNYTFRGVLIPKGEHLVDFKINIL